jgi:hypothetical protein
VAATGLADVGARDPQPLVLRRRRQHLPQQLAVARLQVALPAQGDARLGDPLGEGVANALELFEAGHAWLAKAGRYAGVERKPGEGLGAEAGELMLEAADLTPQLGAREALIASHLKRRKRVSIEQIQHKTRIECKSPGRGRKRATG